MAEHPFLPIGGRGPRGVRPLLRCCSLQPTSQKPLFWIIIIFFNIHGCIEKAARA